MTRAIHKILFPTDFGPSAERAAAYAATLARELGATVHLLHVLDDRRAAGARHESRARRVLLSDQQYYDARGRLAALAAAAVRPQTDQLTLEVRSGTPWKSIVSAAVDYGADLIVMSMPVQSAAGHILAETVADRVIRGAPCPVLAVRRSGAARVHVRPEAA